LNNLEYWKNIASSIEPGEKRVDDSIPLPLVSIYASDSLEKGIALIMAGNEKRGLKFITNCEYLVFRMGCLFSDSGYYLYRLVIQWIRTNRVEYSVLHNLVALKNTEIFEDVVRYGHKDLFEIYQRSRTGIQLSENINEIKFRRFSSKKFHYESIGIGLIEIARYYALMRDHRRIDSTVGAGQNLLEKALRKIPKMLTRRSHHWKKLEKYSDIKLKKMDKKKYQYYLSQREMLRGQIPLYRRQGEILTEIAKLMRNEVSPKYIKEKYELFFNQVINPPGKMSSELCLLDELVWLIVKQKVYDFLLRNPYIGNSFEYMRKNLA